MITFQGKSVYGAIASGKIALLTRTRPEVKRDKTGNPPKELARFAAAKDKAILELRALYEKALKEVGEANAKIFEIHIMMAEDEDFNESITDMILSQEVNAEYAVSITSDNFARMFTAMEDSYMQARAADIRDVSGRIIACLTDNHSDVTAFREPVIICADDLAPSETVSLDKSKVLAFVTAHGSYNSHTAILARNMSIPAIIGVGEDFLSVIKNGDTAIADGFTGQFILHPDKKTLQSAKEKQAVEAEKKELLQKLKGKENITKDGTRVHIYANIGSVDDIGAVLLSDADGIGLFRSEFLYMGSKDYPSEEEQCKVYSRVLESMPSGRVIIRTLDIGADKQVDYFRMEKEENPALGLRAVRLCLSRPEIFKTQLRALYRASAFGKLGIMFPMITSPSELSACLALCEQAKRELTLAGKKYAPDVEIGIMIETPAAAIISDRLAPMVDFFSIGTNDLTQYTLACDRQNPRLEKFCDTHHEAVLRLIRAATENAHRAGAWVGICGELAADLGLTETFLRMGIDELSVSPSFVLKLRERVRGLDLSAYPQ